MEEIKPAIMFVIIFTMICGGIYPAVVTGVASAIFPNQARGSFVVDKGGREIGSRLIGQPFSAPEYFWPRPSATSDFSYNPLGSGGSNSGPTDPDYLKTVAGRIATLRESGISGPVPSELVQASASGLDPHISPESARPQIHRIAKARRVTEEAVGTVLDRATEGRQLGFLGGARVNVLEANLLLDEMR